MYVTDSVWTGCTAQISAPAMPRAVAARPKRARKEGKRACGGPRPSCKRRQDVDKNVRRVVAPRAQLVQGVIDRQREVQQWASADGRPLSLGGLRTVPEPPEVADRRVFSDGSLVVEDELAVVAVVVRRHDDDGDRRRRPPDVAVPGVGVFGLDEFRGSVQRRSSVASPEISCRMQHVCRGGPRNHNRKI